MFDGKLPWNKYTKKEPRVIPDLDVKLVEMNGNWLIKTKRRKDKSYGDGVEALDSHVILWKRIIELETKLNLLERQDAL